MTQALQTAESDISSDWKSEIQGLRVDLQLFRTELKADFATKADLAVLKAEFNAKFDTFETRLTRLMFRFWIGQFAAIAAVIASLNFSRTNPSAKGTRRPASAGK